MFSWGFRYFCVKQTYHIMHQEKVYQVDSISVEIQKDENRIEFRISGKTDTTGWTKPRLIIRNMDEIQENLEVDFVAEPPREHKGIHDPNIPVLTDIEAVEYIELSSLKQPLFSVTAFAKTNEVTKYLNE